MTAAAFSVVEPSHFLAVAIEMPIDGVFIGEEAGAKFWGRRGRRLYGNSSSSSSSSSSDGDYRIVNGVGHALWAVWGEFLACLKLKMN